MNVVHTKTAPPTLTPDKALSLLKKLYLWTPVDSPKKRELEKFIADVPPSQRDEIWAAQVENFIKTNFYQVK